MKSNKLSAKAIHAIEQVITVNRDIVELCQSRGVSVEDLHEVFSLARRGLQLSSNQEELDSIDELTWLT